MDLALCYLTVFFTMLNAVAINALIQGHDVTQTLVEFLRDIH